MTSESEYQHQGLQACGDCLLDDQMQLFWPTALDLADGLLGLEQGETLELVKTLPSDPLDTDAQIDALLSYGDSHRMEDEKPPVLRDDLWGLLCNENTHCYTHLERLGQVCLLAAILSMHRASQCLQSGDASGCFASCSSAFMKLGMALANAGSSLSDSSIQSIARRGAEARLTKDPKQIAKQNVRECWGLWQTNPDRYVGPTAFAKDMLEKYEDLESIEVVMRWCRSWKKEATHQAE